MHLMYIDESGDLSSLPKTGAGASKIQPVLCVGGLMIAQERLIDLTRDWVALKRRFFPSLVKSGARALDWHLAEVKGSEIRKAIRGPKRGRRQAIGFLDRCFDLLECHRCQYAARVFIKVPDEVFKGHSSYTFSVQSLCEAFQHKLASVNDIGIAIADSRLPGPNIGVSHSVFTMKHRALGDAFPRLVEAPVFGHSDNHSGIQLADVLCSAVLFPLCGQFFLGKRIKSIHIHPAYDKIGERYGERLRTLQYRYRDLGTGRFGGGLVVSDRVGRIGASQLFGRYCAPPPSASRTASS